MNIRFIFYALFLSFFLLIPSSSFAQRQVSQDQTLPPNNCNVVTPSNFQACCTLVSPSNRSASCFTFNNTSTNTNTGTGTNNSCDVITESNFQACCTFASVSNRPAGCFLQGTTGSETATGIPTPGQVRTSGITPTGSIATTASNTGLEISAECKQVMGPGGRIQSLLDIFLWIRCVISVYLLPIIFSVAFLIFMYGVIKYVIAADVKDKEEGKKFLIWGLIGLFVMVSVWGIVGLVSNTLGLENTVPQLQQNVYCEGGKKYDPVTQRCR